MKIQVQLTEEEIRNILANYINNEYSLGLKGSELNIEVKSKQNYKSEWERADIRLDVILTK